MKNKETMYIFPAHIEIHGDDFNFEMEINQEMAGEIIAYIAVKREQYVKKGRIIPNIIK